MSDFGLIETKNGRVECYVHSDSLTPNKGAAAILVTCETDFAAKTEEFQRFCRKAARMAYGADAETWEQVVETWPDLEHERKDLSAKLKEEVLVERIVVVKL